MLGVLKTLGSSVPWLLGGWEEEEGAGALARPPRPSLRSQPSDVWVAAAWGVAPGR